MKIFTKLPRSQQAFVLALTLWILAILTVAASFFSLWAQRALSVAQAMQADVQAELDMYNTQSRLIYLMATQDFNIGGMTMPKEQKPIETTKTVDEIFQEFDQARKSNPKLRFEDFLSGKTGNNSLEQDSILSVGGELALDDTPYFGYGNAYFAVQDEGGLLSLNLNSNDIINRLLAAVGVQAEAQEALIDKLRDYTDTDNFHRLNGAEKIHYEKLNLAPPSNAYLKTPMEIYQVLGWSKVSGLWNNHLLSQITTMANLVDRPNFNTAPALVLQVAFNFSPESADRIVKIRKTTPFYNHVAIEQVTGVTPEGDNFYFSYLPSGLFRLTLWHENAKRMRQVHIALTSSYNRQKPWRIEYIQEVDLLPHYTSILPRYVKTPLFSASLRQAQSSALSTTAK